LCVAYILSIIILDKKFEAEVSAVKNQLIELPEKEPSEENPKQEINSGPDQEEKQSLLL
jgi:hypothetical protein